MQISKKKNCNGCRALDGTYHSRICILGYKIENFEKNRHFGVYEPRPSEPCPKPKTIQAFIGSTKKNHNRHR